MSRLLWCYDDRDEVPRWPKPTTPRHENCHTESGAWLVRSGWAQVQHGATSVRAMPEQWLIVKPGPRHQWFAEDTQILSVAFEAKWPDGTHLLDDGLSVALDADEFPELEEHAGQMVEIMERVHPDRWDIRSQEIGQGDFLRLQGFLTRWLGDVVTALESIDVHPSRSEPVDERVLHAMRTIDALPLNEPIDLEALAAQVNSSLVNLRRLFRKQLGFTPRVYWDRLRLEHACRRLAMPNTRPSDVSRELGFKYLPHFSRWFKKKTGRSPANYRQGNFTHVPIVTSHDNTPGLQQ